MWDAIEVAMTKPENLYKKGSITWSVMEGDWEDLTVRQIAEVLDTNQKSVYTALAKIRMGTGYIVPHV